MNYKSSLRGDRCALRGAFLRWMLFNALLAVGPFLVFAFHLFFVYSYNQPYPYPLPWITQTLWSILFWITQTLSPILVGPETMGALPIWSLDSTGQWPAELRIAIFTGLSLLRLGAIFAWGMYRLQRGKYAPYVETLWLLAACGYIALRTSYPHAWSYQARVCVNAGLILLLAAGLVAFVLQRRRPPAWKWKTLE